MNKNYIPLAILTAGILILVAFFVVHINSAKAPTTATSTATSTLTTATSTNGSTIGVSASGTPTIKITQSSSSGPIAPSLNRPMTFAPTLSADLITQLKTQETANIAALKKDPTQAEVWLQLAVDYKIAGDYAGAEAIWIYLTKAAPTSFVAYANLGDLYTNYLKDTAKAEANYKKAIILKPDYIDDYRNLYYLYISKGNTAAAADIIAQGLKANPNNPDLLSLQKQ